MIMAINKFGRFRRVPAELDLAAHARTSRHRQRRGFEVADQLAVRQEAHMSGCIDVPVDYAGDGNVGNVNLGVNLGALFDEEVALNVDIAFEFAGDANIGIAFDLTFDGDSRAKHRFAPFFRRRLF